MSSSQTDGLGNAMRPTSVVALCMIAAGVLILSMPYEAIPSLAWRIHFGGAILLLSNAGTWAITQSFHRKNED
jgi:uncharacterized membrane protein HdeD (DUF308 family)